MFAKHPDIAHRWARKYGSRVQETDTGKMSDMKMNAHNAIAHERKVRRNAAGKVAKAKIGSGMKIEKAKANIKAKARKMSNKSAAGRRK